MKNSNIHNGLNQKEIRDFLSMSIVKNMKNYFNLERENFTIENLSNMEWVIKNSEETIRFELSILNNLKEKQAILKIIEMCKWEEFDVSDETEKDFFNYKLLMNFIGTKDEYKNLLDQIKKEN